MNIVCNLYIVNCDLVNKPMAKIMIVLGFTFLVLGLILNFLPKIAKLPTLPGDIYIQKENFSFYFPLTTSIIISVILSLILWLMSKR